MAFRSVHDPLAYDRRGKHRVRMTVPAQFCRGAAKEARGLSYKSGQTQNLSPAGLYLTTVEPGPFAAGDLLTVSIAIPWEYRRLFPFSRLFGACQVVRVHELDSEDGTRPWGLAMEFCGGSTTMFGAIVI